MIIAVTGRISAGETTLCELLERRGFKRLSLSDILRDMLREQGKPVVRENLRKLGDSLRKKMGKAAIAKLAWEKMKGGGDWVVDSVYTYEEGEFLRSKGAYLVGVVAPVELRYQRSLNRGDGYSSIQEFLEDDEKDRELGIDRMVAEADFVISNDGTIKQLEEKVEGMLKTISSSPSRS